MISTGGRLGYLFYVGNTKKPVFLAFEPCHDSFSHGFQDLSLKIHATGSNVMLQNITLFDLQVSLYT